MLFEPIAQKGRDMSQPWTQPQTSIGKAHDRTVRWVRQDGGVVVSAYSYKEGTWTHNTVGDTIWRHHCLNSHYEHNALSEARWRGHELV